MFQIYSTYYYLDNHTLECVKHHAYLGVILDQTMSFSPHILKALYLEPLKD